MKPLNVWLFVAFILSSVLIGVVGCKKDSPTTSMVSGTVYTPSGKTVPMAKISIAEAEDQFFTCTDNAGSFSLAVPEGKHILKISTGKFFKTELPISVQMGTTTQLNAQQTVLNQEGRFAFVPGVNDHIEHLITDSLGYQITEVFYADIENLSTLLQYDVVFLNCGEHRNLPPQVPVSLNNYLSQGGNLYVSDHAIHFLVGEDILKTSHTHYTPKAQTPCAGSFTGGFMPDSILCYSKYGPDNLNLTAQVVSPTLQPIIGNNIDLHFNLSQWAVLEHVEFSDTRFEELINDPSGYGTMALQIDWNAHQPGGRITYTTFHNSANSSPQVVDFLQWVILNY